MEKTMPTGSLITIRNKHVHPAPAIEVAGRYLSTFEGHCGDQVIILIDREAGVGEILHGDMDWESYPISRGDPFPKMFLSLPERLWVAASWCAALELTDIESMALLSRM